MSIERLQQEQEDTNVMAKAVLSTLLKHIKDTPNDTDLGKKIRANKKAIEALMRMINRL